MSKSSTKKIKVALAGNPNSGKSTLFNVLTGLNQRTGNFPGVTVEKKTGSVLWEKEEKKYEIEFIDLPGSYSLFPSSLDEEVAAEVLHHSNNVLYPDLTIIVLDATNLKRSMLMASQIIDLGRPTIIVLNMIDLLAKEGTVVDVKKMQVMLGVPVLMLNAIKKNGINELKETILSFPLAPHNKFIDSNGEVNSVNDNLKRFEKINTILESCIRKQPSKLVTSLTEKLDNLFTHRIWGYVTFLFVLLLVFQSVFYLARFPMDWLEALFQYLTQWGNESLPKGVFTSLLINGILAGLGGVVVFIPQIALLFGFIAVLEDTGYMARISFIMDKIMRKFGLNGRSIIPLISGVACAVPAIMGTRTISNWKERMITILVTPLMSCSARLPVYTLLISFVIPQNYSNGFFSLHGFVLLALYLIGFFAAILTALLLKYILKSKEKSYFMMELPVYRTPRFNSVLLVMFSKVKVFVLDAGKIIVAISVVLWVLSSYAPNNAFEKIEDQANQLNLNEQEKQYYIKANQLEASYAGIMGRAIEPAIAPLGFDWKVGIALITSFAAREVFVGTMATIYSVGNEDDTRKLHDKMRSDIDPQAGKPVFSMAVALSLIIFYVFAMQCMSTLAVVYRETGAWKWPIIQFVYMSALAYFSALIVFRIFS